MPTHLNPLNPMRISGTPRSFLNLDSRCPTSIEAIVIGGGLDNPLPTFWVGLVSMNMLSLLFVVARRSSAKQSTRVELGVSCSSAVVARSGVNMRDWNDGHWGEDRLVHEYRSW
jgi:hypothetical protein